VVYFGGFFAKLGHFAGFSLHIINLAVRISAAEMAGDIILFSIYYSPEGILFSIYYSPEGTAKLRLVIVFFKVPNSLEGCDGWSEGGEYYVKHQSLGGTVERYTPLTAA